MAKRRLSNALAGAATGYLLGEMMRGKGGAEVPKPATSDPREYDAKTWAAATQAPVVDLSNKQGGTLSRNEADDIGAVVTAPLIAPSAAPVAAPKVQAAPKVVKPKVVDYGDETKRLAARVPAPPADYGDETARLAARYPASKTAVLPKVAPVERRTAPTVRLPAAPVGNNPFGVTYGSLNGRADGGIVGSTTCTSPRSFPKKGR